MNPKHLSLLLAASLLAVPLASSAQDSAAAAAAAAAEAEVDASPAIAPAKDELDITLSAASQEIQDVLDAPGPLARNLERLQTFRHPPATAARLNKLFGNERPWSFEKRADQPGYRLVLQPLRYTMPEGGLLEWSAFPIDFSLDQSGKQLASQGTWPELAYQVKDVRIAMRDTSFAAKQRRGPGRLWYGKVEANAERLEIAGSGDTPFSVQLRDLWLRSDIDERKGKLAVVQSFGIKSIEVAGQTIDDLKFAYRIDNLSRATAVALGEAERKANLQREAGQTDLEVLLPIFKELVRSASKNKTVLKIDEISAVYKGHKLQLRGTIGVNGVQESDLKDMAALARRFDARFEVRVPVALVREIAAQVAQQQGQAQAAKGLPVPDAATAAQRTTDMLVGMLLGKGYAKLEDWMLVSTIEIRSGKVRVNGKDLDLPKIGKPKRAADAPAPEQAAAADNFMHARRLPDSCTLPDYPAPVLEHDAPFTIALRYTVDAQGGVSDVQVGQASSYPAFDQALVQAFGRCRFIPALREGKPVEHRDGLILEREPGSVRP